MDESRIEEIDDELTQLRRKTDALWQRDEVLQKVVAELILTLFNSPEGARHWADKIGGIAEMHELFCENHAALPWLRDLRERLLDSACLPSKVIVTSTGAKLRPRSRAEKRERLSILTGGLHTSVQPPVAPPSPPAISEEGLPHKDDPAP
jgi:hypothetical protein